MFSKSSLLAVVCLAVAALSSPIKERHISLSFLRNLNVSGHTLPELDRIRATNLIQSGLDMQQHNNSTQHSRRASSFDATNTAIMYTANVQVGSPPTTYTLLIDTGSSNTWIGAGKEYVQTTTSKATGNKVSVSYGSGGFSGEEYFDTLAFSSDLTITNQSIGVADTANGFQGLDGILGIGPAGLTRGTVENTDTVPTVSDNLKSQNKISTEVIGISYYPTTYQGDTNGELTFGDVDPSKFTGSITYVPITTTAPASSYWGIDQAVNYGSTPLLGVQSGIVDTGTTLVLIATNAFTEYAILTGGVHDPDTGLLKITQEQYENLQPLNFEVGGTTFALPPNGQIWPRALNGAIGGDQDSIYLIVGDIGKVSGTGLDFINGYTFLERFYSVYDTTNSRVGLAYTPNTNAEIN